jgi:O-antigen/teichoic acid export membrane protein
VSTRKALALSFLDRYSGIVIHTASSMVIARLLTPSEIGIYSVTMVLLGFVATFRDLGAGQYLVQNKVLSEEKMRATWSVQLALGWFLALIVLSAAVPVAGFYREPAMTNIMLVLALNFAITPFLAYPNAWLVREMRFGSIAAVRFIGAAVHAVAAISMAWLGYGPVSLAWANALTTVASIVAIWIFAHPTLPWKPITMGIGEVISFGGKLTATSLMNTLAGGAPELLLGKIQTMVDAGLFSRGQGLVAMFQRLVMDAVNAVALPYFAKQSRESQNLGASFLVAMELISGLGWSFFFGITLMAYPAIRILYGPQWDDAVDAARWLAVASAISIPAAICPPPLIAIGAINDVLKATLLSTVVTLTATAFGVGFGLEALSQCLIVASTVWTVFWLYMVRKHIKFATGDLLRALGKSLLVALGAAVAPLFVILNWGWRPKELLVAALLSGIGGALGAVVVAWLTKHHLWLEAMRMHAKRKSL